MENEGTPVFLTVDEIERDQNNHLLAILVAESGEQVIVPLTLLPDEIQVGDVLSATFTPTPDERDRRRSTIADLQRRLFGSD